MTGLARPKDEVQRRLEQQIEKADTILEGRDIGVLKEEETKWSSFTELLLKKLFSTDEFATEFRNTFRSAVIVRGGRSFDERLKSAKKTLILRKAKLESFFERLELIDEVNHGDQYETKSAVEVDNKSVFIVHGHHGEAKLEVARFLERLGLNAIILHEQASGSKTIIEKIEAHTDVGYGVVLYTDCDVGSTKSAPEDLKSRARQNVVFEHGFLMGKLGRDKVAALVKGDIETPNDISGVVYIGMNDESWKNALVKELMAADIEVDVTKLF